MAKALGMGGNSPSLASSSSAADLQPRTVSVRLDPQRLAVLERMRDADGEGPTLSDIIRNMLDERLSQGASPARPGPTQASVDASTGSRRQQEKVLTDHFERDGRPWAEFEPSVVEHFETLLEAQNYSDTLQAALRQEFERSTDVVLAQTRSGLSELKPLALTFGSHSDPSADDRPADTAVRRRLDLNALLVDPAQRSKVANLGLMEAIACGVAPLTQVRAHCRAVGIRLALAGMLGGGRLAESRWTPEEQSRLPFVRAWLAATGYPSVVDFLAKCQTQDSADIIREVTQFINTRAGQEWLSRACDPTSEVTEIGERSEPEAKATGALVAAFATAAWCPSTSGGPPRALCGPSHFHGRQGASPCLEVVFSDLSSDLVSLGARIRYDYAIKPQDRAIAAIQYEFRRTYAAVDLTTSQHKLDAADLAGKLPVKPQPSELWQMWRVSRQRGPQSVSAWPSLDPVPTPM